MNFVEKEIETKISVTSLSKKNYFYMLLFYIQTNPFKISLMNDYLYYVFRLMRLYKI